MSNQKVFNRGSGLWQQVIFMADKQKKRGMWDMPVWLIWSLIALVVILVVLAVSSGKMSSLLRTIGGLFTPG